MCSFIILHECQQVCMYGHFILFSFYLNADATQPDIIGDKMLFSNILFNCQQLYVQKPEEKNKNNMSYNIHKIT